MGLGRSDRLPAAAPPLHRCFWLVTAGPEAVDLPEAKGFELSLCLTLFDVNDEAKGGYRRVEILTGPGRRRRWSAGEKARIVAETLVPGARVSEVARRWQVCSQQVFGWRRAMHQDLPSVPRTTTPMKSHIVMESAGTIVDGTRTPRYVTR